MVITLPFSGYLGIELMRKINLGPVIVINRYIRSQLDGPVQGSQAILQIASSELLHGVTLSCGSSNVVDAFDPSVIGGGKVDHAGGRLLTNGD